jgi:hypothetical protein
MPDVDVRATPVWMWRMRHPELQQEWGMRIERPFMKDDGDLYVSITLNGHVHRSPEGWLFIARAARLEPLEAHGEMWRERLRAEGFRDVEDE